MISKLRRTIVGIIIVSFGLAALGGIAVLLGGDLGPDAARVLGTTAVVGAYSVAVLCCTSLIGRRAQVVGFVGAAIAIVTACLTLVVIWSTSWPSGDTFWRVLWTGIVLTIALAFASLLLLLADRRQAAVRVGLVVTLGLFALVVVMVTIAIWVPDVASNEGYGRVVGIAAILAALGAIVVPVLSILLRDAHENEPTLSPELQQRLIETARERGIAVDELVAPVLRDIPRGETGAS